jgi:hypothetical protein
MISRALCARCKSPVVVQDLDYYAEQGYWAYCPAHDEDMFKFECIVEVKEYEHSMQLVHVSLLRR